MGGMDTDGTTDELGAYLDAVAREGSYVAERRLGGRGDATELVYFAGEGGSRLGPFVRKRIDLSTGLGGGYEALWRAQRAGRRFGHLPRIVDCYKTGAELVVVSEYVPGETLEERVLACGGSRELAADVFPRICAAVSELHGALDPPLIHRDLTPRNIVIAPEGLFLIDLGIARRYREDAASDTVRFGTRAYAPPEQYGFGQTDVRSDVFALGGVLWFCLTGEEPPSTLDGPRAAERVGAPLADIVRRARALDPKDRFASAAALGEAAALALADGAAAPGAPVSPASPAATVAGTGAAGADGEGSAADAPGAAPEIAPFAGEPEEVPAAAGPASGPGGPGEPAAPSGRRLAAGIVRNVALALFGVLCAVKAAQSVASPAPADAGQPLWYRFVLNVLLTLPLICGALYLAMDRAVLARLFPAVSRRTRLADAAVIGAYLLIVFAAAVIAATVLGV